jgi:hypothetical protein
VHFSPPMDMVDGWMFVVLGPILGILFLIPTIPLEAFFISRVFGEDKDRSFFISLVMNIASAAIGAAYFSSFAITETDPNIGWPLTFVGTLIIEFIILVRMIDPRESRWKILLFDIFCNLASYIATFAVYFLLVYLVFAVPYLL